MVLWTALLLGLGSIISPCSFLIIPFIVHYFQEKKKAGFYFLGGVFLLFTCFLAIASFTGTLLSVTLVSYFPFLAAIFAIIAGIEMLGMIKLSLPFSLSMQNKHPFVMGIFYGAAALGCVTPLTAALFTLVVSVSVFDGIIAIILFLIGFFIPLGVFGVLFQKVSFTSFSHVIEKIRRVIGIILICGGLYMLYWLL